MFITRKGNNGRTYTYKDLAGLKVGLLSVLHRGIDAPTKHRTQMMWTCLCECGSIKDYSINNLMSGVKRLSNGDAKIFSCGCKRSLPFGVSACKEVYRQYQVHAQKRGYDFKLSWDDFVSITKQNCFYCDSPPKNKIGRTKKKRGNGHYIYNGIDRKDNTKGYFIGNVVPCCKRCNRAKDVFGQDEFLKWIEQVYNHTFGEHEFRKILRIA